MKKQHLNKIRELDNSNWNHSTYTFTRGAINENFPMMNQYSEGKI